VIWTLLCISRVLAASKGQRESDTVPTWYWQLRSMERQYLLASCDGISKCDMGANVNIWSDAQFYRLKHSRSSRCSIQHKLSCDILGGCRGASFCLLVYKGCENLIYKCLWSFTSKITHDSEPKINVALLTLIVKMGQGECCILFGLKRWRLQWL